MKQLLDDTPLTFGKLAGNTPNQIAEVEPSYIVWLHENLDKMVCTNKLYEHCKDIVESYPETSYEDEKDLDDYYEYNGW